MPSYEQDLRKFEGYNTQVLGISVDHVPCLKAWAESLGDISYPLLSDFWPHGAVAQQYGAFRQEAGHSERALFVIDKEGIIRYIDIHEISQQPDNEHVFQALREIEPQATIVEDSEPRKIPVQVVRPGPTAQPARPRSVVMYCRPGCIDCRMARNFLDQRGVAYTEIDIRADPQAEARLRKWTGGPLITPVFDIDGKIIIDFKRAELEQTLSLK
ncbi:MAG: redoxin domain-containing protein [Anaerolineae bacterium]|nr:redoxin domain-containing protein [Anaerolineae bacterium]